MSTITALVRIAGMHHWPLAHGKRLYLRAPHRHLFHLRATVTVHHDERAVEFHDLADATITAAYALTEHGSTPPNFGPKSCEAIARGVLTGLLDQGLDAVAVSCSEDDEFTATITKDDL